MSACSCRPLKKGEPIPLTKKTALIDVHEAGASGDMFLAALLDLMGEDDALLPVAAALLIYDPTLRVKVVQEEKAGVNGKRLEVVGDKGIRLSPKSMLEVLQTVSEELELSKTAAKLAERALDEILQAEVRAHDTPIEELHLHETGQVDTVLDIVGTVYLLEKMGLLNEVRFVATRVAVGSGTIETEHGELEVPVPAVAEILVAHDVPFLTGKAETEILTPTGAALLVSLAQEYVDSTEDFVVAQQGTGFGSRDLGEDPNRMKISLGNFKEAEGAAEAPEPKSSERTERKASQVASPPTRGEERAEVFEQWNDDSVIVIEANVDDVDGEVMGSLFDTLLSEGLAYDVVMIPAYGKKNRPCFVVKVIAAKTGLKSIAEIMIRHLGTLGIRYTSWQRLKAARETIVCKLEIDNKDYMVRVKISRGPDGSIINIKPEADDIMKVSAETGIPVRELKPRVALQAHAVTE